MGKDSRILTQKEFQTILRSRRALAKLHGKDLPPTLIDRLGDAKLPSANEKLQELLEKPTVLPVSANAAKEDPNVGMMIV